MSWIAVGVAAVPTIYKFATGLSQSSKGNNMHPVDPGFQANPELEANKNLINNFYSNYQLPGKNQIMSNLGTTQASALSSLERGASTGEDVLDGVTRINYNNGQALSNLGIQEAQNKQALLPQVMAANAAAGNEQVRRNDFDNERYDRALGVKDAYQRAGAENAFSAGDSLASLAGSMLSYRSGASDTPTTGKVATLPPTIQTSPMSWNTAAAAPADYGNGNYFRRLSSMYKTNNPYN